MCSTCARRRSMRPGMCRGHEACCRRPTGVWRPTGTSPRGERASCWWMTTAFARRCGPLDAADRLGCCRCNMDVRGARSATGASVPARVLGLDDVVVPSIGVAALRDQLLAGTAVVIDLDWSRSFSCRTYSWRLVSRSARGWRGHLAHCRRRRRYFVFTSPDGSLARLAAAEWNGRAPAAVFALSGGTEAWVAAGLSSNAGQRAWRAGRTT